MESSARRRSRHGLKTSGRETLIDLLETLGIDLSDLGWRADEFAALSLPSWKLWRQDDNGVRALVDSFTGYRKARAALAAFEGPHHKQTYWLEEPA